MQDQQQLLKESKKRKVENIQNKDISDIPMLSKIPH